MRDIDCERTVSEYTTRLHTLYHQQPYTFRLVLELSEFALPADQIPSTEYSSQDLS